MNSLDDFIQNAGSHPLKHPQIEVWDSILSNPNFHDKAVQFYRERKGLTFSQAYLYLKWTQDNMKMSDKHEYHLELDLYLYKKGIYAVSEDNEAQRGGFWLKYRFEKGDIEYGDGYFSSVLIERIDSLFGQNPVIKDTMKKIARNRASKGTTNYSNCLAFVNNVLEEYLTFLKYLNYPADIIKTISTYAINSYLDERFHITNRELLGFS